MASRSSSVRSYCRRSEAAVFRTFPPNPWSRMNSVADTVACTFSVVRVKRSAASAKRTRMIWTPAAFASASTLHGLGHICGAGRPGVRQTLWALAFLASLAFFLYQAA